MKKYTTIAVTVEVKKLLEELKERGIEVVVEETRRAWRTYNELASSGRKVVGAFHLTC